jgi:UPF0755 protein
VTVDPRFQARRITPARGTVSRAEVVGVNRGTDTTGSPRAPRGRRGSLKGLAFLLVLGAIVLLALFAFVGPVLAGVARGIAESNPATLRWPFVADLVRGDVADELDRPAGTDPTPVRFVVPAGASAAEVGGTLVDEGLVQDRFAFDYLVYTQDVAGGIEAGTYVLDRTMTPRQIVARLQDAPEQTIEVALREGLRIEQITAYLETLDLQMDVGEFYRLATDPPPELRDEYPFLETLPAGRSLEGYLGAGSYAVFPDVTPGDLLRKLLDHWQESVDPALLERARTEDRDFYKILTLASIVEKEATLPDERALIAGVYRNRLDREMLLNADPTVYYGWDTVQLRNIGLEEWPTYAFWTPIGRPLRGVDLPQGLHGYQTYQRRGLVPGPICTPSPGSIEAAMDPDQKEGFLFFVAIPDGDGAHAFARTLEEHEANLKKYGYL